MKLYLGIDPGRQTGIAVYDPKEKKILSLHLLDFWSTIDFIENFESMIKGKEEMLFASDDFELELEVVIEDPNLNAPTFLHKKMGVQVALSKAQDVGRNKEQAFLLMDYMTRKKINFKTSKPTQSKWDAKQMAQIARWTGPSNEHNRDAARLVFGR